MSIYYTFDEISKKCTVNNIEFNVYSKYKNGIKIKDHSSGNYGYSAVYGNYTLYGLLELGIYNERIAHFLNFMLNAKRYDLDILGGGQGGGILLNGGVRVVITPYNEIAFLLAVQNKTINGPYRNIPNINFYKNTIYRSMRSTMNHFLKEYALEKDEPLKLNDNGYEFNVTMEDYEILHAFFGQTDYKLKKYTKEQLDAVFGEKISDQFVISAMELICQEIEKLEQEAKNVKDNISNKWANIRNELEKKWNTELADVEIKYNEKIKELENEISSLKTKA